MNPENDAIIVTIHLGNGALDNDYTFYQSGEIKRVYDTSGYSLNNVDLYKAENIDASTRQRLLDRCPTEFKEQITSILSNGNQ